MSHRYGVWKPVVYGHYYRKFTVSVTKTEVVGESSTARQPTEPYALDI